MTRAAIYVRVSSAHQEQDGTSLESQEERCRNDAAERGLTVDETNVYREVYSGAVLHERPQLTALRQEARDGAFSAVICYAVDRLSRNQAHLYIVAEELEGTGVRLEFVTEDFEDSAVGKFIRSAKAFAAEVEREKFRERSMRGKVARVQSGKLMHGKTPLYGYDWTDNSKRPAGDQPRTGRRVRRMFAESVEGKPLRALRDLSAMTVSQRHVAPSSGLRRHRKDPAQPGLRGRGIDAFRERYERIPGPAVRVV